MSAYTEAMGDPAIRALLLNSEYARPFFPFDADFIRKAK